MRYKSKNTGRFRGFDLVRSKNIGFYTEKGYSELNAPGWKVAVTMVPVDALGNLKGVCSGKEVYAAAYGSGNEGGKGY